MPARTPPTRPQLITAVGWFGTLLFALLVTVVGDEPGTGAVLAAIALAMATWVAWRGSRPAFWVSAVLGALHTLEQAAYLVSDASDGHSRATTISDAVGLAGAVLILVGSVAALRSLYSDRSSVAHRGTVPTP